MGAFCCTIKLQHDQKVNWSLDIWAMISTRKETKKSILPHYEQTRIKANDILNRMLYQTLYIRKTGLQFVLEKQIKTNMA